MNGRRIWSRDCGRTGRCAGEAGGAGHARQEELFRGLLFVKAVVSRLVRAGLWVFFAMFALVVARIGLLEDRAFDMPFAWALLAVAFAAAAAALLGRLRTTKCLVMRRQRRWILAAVLLLAFVWQCILGWKLRCSPAGTPPIYIELKSLHESALAVLRGEGLPDRLYFATYPHQFPLFLLLTAYYAVIQAVLGYVPASSGLLLNLVFIDLGVLFLLLLTKELRGQLADIFEGQKAYENLQVTILSFGFKNGIPEDADLLFDVRFLPNPYYDPELRSHTGLEQSVRDYVCQDGVAEEFLQKLYDMICFLIPHYIEEGKNQLVIGVGCTGGHHRSVTIAELLYERLKKTADYGLRIDHRDIER